MQTIVIRNLFHWLIVVCATLLIAQIAGFFLPKLALALEGFPREITFLCGLLLFIISMPMTLFFSERRLSLVGIFIGVVAILVGCFPKFIHL
jgi:hypothetical protein